MVKTKKKPIVQKDLYGCGAACIAFVVDKTYDQVARYFGRKKLSCKGIRCKEIVKYLNKLGYKAEYHYLKGKWRKMIYKDNTIVLIKRSKKYPVGHYLVRYKIFWMDPWINLPKNQDIRYAKAGFRKRLPGKPIYGIFIIDS